MKYKETGFRAVYKTFTCFPIEAAKGLVKDFPGADEANCVLTYGYIDREAGLSLEILACGESKGGKSRFFETRNDIRAYMRIGSVVDTEFAIIDPNGTSLYEKYKEKIDVLSIYDPDEEVEESRKMDFLDDCRNDEYPDDVLVYLLKDGLKPESCWARIVGLQHPCIIGDLLNEPYQDFKYHRGDRIGMLAKLDENKKVVLVSDMNPDMKLTREDLEDGQMLKDAIHTFNAEQTEQHFIEVLEFLRDSDVWVPCNAIMSENDQANMEELLGVAEAGEDIDAFNENIVGKVFVNQDPVRLVPDILQNGDDFFFPVFSSEEEMGEYGTHFSKVPSSFLHAINLARNNEKDLKGIVVNAFSEPFVLDSGIYDIVENMKSRITEVH